MGGRDIANKTNRIIKQLFTDDLCKNYSFYGKRLGKNPFSNLRMKDIVISKTLFKIFFIKNIYDFKKVNIVINKNVNFHEILDNRNNFINI